MTARIPLRLVVTQSTLAPGLLSLRLADKADESGTMIKRALVAGGYKPGDIVTLELVDEDTVASLRQAGLL